MLRGRERSAALAWVCGVVVAVSGAGAQVVPTVTVSTSVSGGTSLSVGDIRTVTVSALVTDPGSGTDGIFTFDQKFVLKNVVNPTDPVGLSILGLADRPGVDTSFGGGDGIATSLSLDNIAGGYFDKSLGIGSPVVLYTVQVQAMAPGVFNVVSGPDTTPFGFDLVLQQSKHNLTVVYDAGVDLTVTPSTAPVPLPSAATAGIFGFVGVGVLRRRRRAEDKEILS